MGIRPEFHLVEKESGKVYIPPALYKLNRDEKNTFCDILRNVKVPDGYSSNISRCVQLTPPKLIGLKSHDYHILMQQLLPIALRKMLSTSIRSPLLRLCAYFRELCSKEIFPEDVARLENEIPVILCELEKIFPPSFFDIMVHLPVHLATEVKLAGPVYYRLMYPIERYLGTLKSHVRNRSILEGSIAKGYLAEECLTFCSLYLAEYVETKFNRTSRNEDRNTDDVAGLDIFNMGGHPLGKATPTEFDDETLKKGHQYVLFNCKTVQPYIDQHKTMVEQTNPNVAPHRIEEIHSNTFADWFAQQVEGLEVIEGDPISRDLKFLGKRPNFIGVKYEKYVVNGFRFHIKDLESSRTTQNSGIVVRASTSSYSSVRDQNQILSELDYYGQLRNIIELDYSKGRRVVLFECDWVSKGKRLKQDGDGFTLANFEKVKHHNEPFILASQAEQVFYVRESGNSNWHVVVSTVARARYKMESLADVETFLQSNVCNPTGSFESDDFILVREEEEEGTEIDIDRLKEKSKKSKKHKSRSHS